MKTNAMNSNEKLIYPDQTGNILDFIVDDKIILEFKAKPIVLKEDYYQIQRYL